MQLYKSVYRAGEFRETINKSIFIAHVSPVRDDREAREFIAGIKEEYKDATHNVPAFVTGNKQEHQWASDDGEPQGTSGPPVLNLLTENELTNLALVVTRYFGGIKLGTGGLVRAYSSAARGAIENAGICSVNSVVAVKCRMEYSYLNKLRSMEKDGGFYICNEEYTDKITVDLKADSEKREELLSMIGNLTSGKGEILDIAEGTHRILL